MTRIEAMDLLYQHLNNANLIKHVLATEVVMRALAKRLAQNEDDWALTGLLHDIDYEQTAQTPERHGMNTADLLSEFVDQEICHAIMSHNDMTEVKRESLLDFGLYACDPITGLITAAALVRPSKKIEDVEVASILKKWSDKTFAKGADRGQIDTCEKLGIPREEFIKLALEAMKEISLSLGL